jgi:hypothetical protein
LGELGSVSVARASPATGTDSTTAGGGAIAALLSLHACSVSIVMLAATSWTTDERFMTWGYCTKRAGRQSVIQ